jgi:hypothetical protein
MLITSIIVMSANALTAFATSGRDVWSSKHTRFLLTKLDLCQVVGDSPACRLFVHSTLLSGVSLTAGSSMMKAHMHY